MKKTLFLAVGLVMILWPLLLMAVGLKVSPSELKTAGNIGLLIKQVLSIQNPDTVAADFQVYSDDFSTAITINPSAFSLNPQETKVVTLEAIFLAPGIYKTNISVVAKPQINNKFRTNTGIKIPWAITIAQPNSNHAFLASLSGFLNKQISLGYLLAVLVVLLIFWLIWVTLKKRSQPPNKG